MGAQEPGKPFSRAGLGTVVRPPPNPNALAADDHLVLRPVEVADGLSHHGEPAEEEEVIVVEEPERPEKVEHRVVRAPRVPTQEERDAHDAMHIPHEEWCETCMAGRGRNKPHRQRKSKGAAQAPKAGSTPSGEPVERVNCKGCPHGDEALDSAKAFIEISVDALNGLTEEAEEWEELEFNVDSGAGTTVIGPEHAKAVQASDPDPTANYMLADGSIIHNQGGKNFVASTEDWDMKSMKAAVTKVETPLLSVSAVVLAGGTVVFSPSGSYIEAKGGHKTPLTASKGVYNLKMWVPKNQGQPFPGQA